MTEGFIDLPATDRGQGAKAIKQVQRGPGRDAAKVTDFGAWGRGDFQIERVPREVLLSRGLV